MNRRRVLKGLAAGALGLPAVSAAAAAGDDYAGRFFIFVQADGGWDPTSFCDPKTNTPGEREINTWARRRDIQQAGRLRYAPFAANETFFGKYHRRMLVINGVDAQTNSHSVGVTHNWSGRNAAGFPTTTALLAAHHAPNMPLAYLNFGGFAATEGVIRFSRMFGSGEVKDIAYPNRNSWSEEERGFHDANWARVLNYRARRIARLSQTPGLLPRLAHSLANHAAAMTPEARAGLRRFADALPGDDKLPQDRQFASSGQRLYSDIRRQAQLAVTAFRSGAAVSADLFLGGFDTHKDNDALQGWLLRELVGGVDFLWDHAEEQGVADRLVVVIGSDFGRTNHYNAEGGKDHWPIGSFVVMEKNRPWTNRAVGETDDLHFAQRINPATLKRDDRNGTIIYPKHVHKALRGYLGLEESPSVQRFPFNSTEDFAFFG